MKKVLLFSLFLMGGLAASQILPHTLGTSYELIKNILGDLMFICLAFIMINVGREFELDKKNWRSYINDYFIAMATAAAPWLMVAVYFMFLLDNSMMSNWDAWKENLLLSRFAAPTSAGILFTMLAAAGLKNVWIYKKTQVLAIFDDLDTILLMIPLQILMIGLKWQLFVILFFVCGLLWFGWVKLASYKINQSPFVLLLYALGIVLFCETVYLVSKRFMGEAGGIHLEVLLPAFVLGMVMKSTHGKKPTLMKRKSLLARIFFYPTESLGERVTDIVSYIFMFLVGISTPLIIGVDLVKGANLAPQSITAAQPMMSWGTIALHVVMVTIISNIGKMFPLFFYRDHHIYERLALSIGMFTRGEVGAGIIIIALGYSLGGPALIIAILSLVLNLILTGFFVMKVKSLAQHVYGDQMENRA